MVSREEHTRTFDERAATREACGQVHIVTGAGKTGAALVAHADVNEIAFTGSTDVGKRIQKVLAGTNKKLTFELGGKAANIVLAMRLLIKLSNESSAAFFGLRQRCLRA